MRLSVRVLLNIQLLDICQYPLQVFAPKDGLCHFGTADISGRHTAEIMRGEGENSVHKYVLSFLR